MYSNSYDQQQVNYGAYQTPNCGPCYQPQAVAPVAQVPAQALYDFNDPEFIQLVEQIVHSFNQVKQPTVKQEMFEADSTCPGRVINMTRRLPTPPPDVIDRVTVVKPTRDVVNLIIEKPDQPPPCLQQREVPGKPSKPIIQPRVVSVPPRSNPCPCSQVSKLPCPHHP